MPDKDKKPNDDSPKPGPQPDKNNQKGFHFVSTKINDNTYKYQITLDGGEIDFSDFIELLKNKKGEFFQAFQGALKDANSKFPAYFWECPPISEKSLDKPFEFVVIKSEGLASATQDFEKFVDKFIKFGVSGEPKVISFHSPNKDGILVCPSPFENEKSVYTYQNISNFTKTAPKEKQLELWQEVATQLFQELAKNDGPRWLSTHGGGVSYLHVRIYDNPKYYSHAEYKKRN